MVQALFEQGEKFFVPYGKALRKAFLLQMKAQAKLADGIVPAKLAPCMVVHVLKLFPQFRAMTVKLAKLLQRLQRAAPAGNTLEYAVQAIPIEASLQTIRQTILFRHAPIDKRVMVLLHPIRLISGNSYILDQVKFLPHFPQIAIDNAFFQSSRTPASPRPRPAHPLAVYKRGIFSDWLVFISDKP